MCLGSLTVIPGHASPTSVRCIAGSVMPAPFLVPIPEKLLPPPVAGSTLLTVVISAVPLPFVPCADQEVCHECEVPEKLAEDLKEERNDEDPKTRKNGWPLPLLADPPVPLPGWYPMPFGLERYWREGFLLLFSEWHQPTTGHTWSLQPVTELPTNCGHDWPWHQVVHRAKVRFYCQRSGHGWTSMNGHVAFAFRLKRNGDVLAGEVLFKLYGQECNRCADEKSPNEDAVLFETPLWYPEEIYRALDHLRSRVGETYYGFKKVAKVPQGIRAGKPSHPHLPRKCQACKDGICRARLS